MVQLTDRELTVKEAAFVTGVAERTVNHEIDARIIPAMPGRGDRRIRGVDALYLSAVRNVREDLGQPLRRRLRDAIAKAASEDASEATVAHFRVSLRELEKDTLEGFRDLDAARGSLIESRAEVLAGEPVIRGTRIAARHIADLVKRGASNEDIRSEFDIDTDQIRAAVVFDRVTPRRGRPTIRRKRTVHVPAD